MRCTVQFAATCSTARNAAASTAATVIALVTGQAATTCAAANTGAAATAVRTIASSRQHFAANRNATAIAAITARAGPSEFLIDIDALPRRIE